MGEGCAGSCEWDNDENRDEKFFHMEIHFFFTCEFVWIFLGNLTFFLKLFVQLQLKKILYFDLFSIIFVVK